MKYRAEIDGLRALAVLPVILFHAGFEWFSGGFVGVDVFFVISGYLITTIIISEMAEGRFSIVNFYERRARRILPALFFVMAVCLPFSMAWLAPSDLNDFGQSLVSTATFSSNILFWWERGYFGTALELKPLLHTWSLAVEEQFYILFPILILLTWRFGKRNLIFLLTAILIVSFSLAHLASIYGVYDRIITGSFYLIPTRAWELLTGALLAFYLKDARESSPSLARELAGVAGILLIIAPITIYDHSTPFPSVYTLAPVLGTALVIALCTAGTSVGRLLSGRFIVFFGLISYSAYLWHQPIFALTRHSYGGAVSDIWYVLLSLLSLLLAYVSWKWIEAPFRSKEKFNRNQIFSSSAAGIFVFVIIGSTLSLTDGLLRFRPMEEQKIYEEFIELGEYNPVNMAAFSLQPFDHSDVRKKLFVVGDSYAEDLVNAIVESNLNLKYQVSTYRIPANCGVLYIERSELESYQPTSCFSRPNFFNEPRVSELLNQADEVWVASSWLDWQLEFLGRSLSKLDAMSEQLTLFGSKAFELKSASQFKNEFGMSGLVRKFEISDRQRSLSSQLQTIAEQTGITYIDPMYVICESNLTCQHSYDGQNVISVDGGHLTKYGAAHFGSNLYKALGYDLEE